MFVCLAARFNVVSAGKVHLFPAQFVPRERRARARKRERENERERGRERERERESLSFISGRSFQNANPPVIRHHDICLTIFASRALFFVGSFGLVLSSCALLSFIPASWFPSCLICGFFICRCPVASSFLVSTHLSCLCHLLLRVIHLVTQSASTWYCLFSRRMLDDDVLISWMCVGKGGSKRGGCQFSMQTHLGKLTCGSLHRAENKH